MSPREGLPDCAVADQPEPSIKPSQMGSVNELDSFVPALSHDLQEPLNSIVLAVDVILRQNRTNLDPATQKLLSRIGATAARARTLVEDVLKYGAISGGGRAEGIAVNAREAIANALLTLDGSLQESQGEVTVEDFQAEVTAQPVRLWQVFQNLLSNAIRYRKAGTRPEIRISAERQGAEWVFTVRDEGIGFGPQYAERIFDPLHRLHGRELAGSGLGLAICKTIVEQYGGRIWAEGEEGRGASFYFSLPAAHSSAARHTQKA